MNIKALILFVALFLLFHSFAACLFWLWTNGFEEGLQYGIAVLLGFWLFYGWILILAVKS
ncbi:hypothetical protein [Candidatus Aciduliprofundum boonei]|uniref:hypothetical protein n=1 Tax=Candidatus Aciduliprofundum boonei TaxID=379547 RepID=UPI00064EF992|nr:hypothetical protein [Candidatus Aciduliprofundum boonei]HII55423.1 hypothetical protein [Candidatus Aciduliprofundum boonei]